MRLRSVSAAWCVAGVFALASCGARARARARAPAPARAPSAQPAVRPVVLLLHGRGLLGRDSAVLRRAWEHSLHSGALGLAGVPILGDSDVRVVWYADVLDPASSASCAFPAGDPRANRVMGGDGALQIITSSMGNLLGAFGNLLGDDEADTQIRAVGGDLQFLGDAGKRCAAEERLSAALARAKREGRPVVLVAHSFGSLVAYDALTARGPDTSDAPVQRLVTIGAMIGAPTIRHLLFGGSESDSLSLPPGVKSWVNVRNPADPLAVPLSPVAHGLEVGNRAAIRDTITSPSDDDPDAHEMMGYLRDTVTAKAVLSEWCEAFQPASARPVACARIKR